MHLMEGYLPVAFCVTWGIICLPFLAAGIDFPEKKSKRKSKDDHADRHVRRVYFRDLVFKDPVGHRKLFPYDRNRTRRDPVGTGSSQCAGDHRIVVPGDLIGSWRTDNIGSEYIFHGDRRTACVVWTL